MCNTDDFQVDEKWWGMRKDLTIHLSDNTIDDIAALGTIGGGAATAIAGILKKAGVVSAGAFASPIILFAAGVIGIYWGTIQLQNDDCGVEIKVRMTPTPATAVPTVHSQ